MVKSIASPKSYKQYFINVAWMTVGAFLAALSIQVFLYPNKLIDGGVIGISLICARLFGSSMLPFFLVIFNIPFIYLAYRSIRKSFVIQMLFAVVIFAVFLGLLERVPPFDADMLEVIVFGGAILGAGVGLIIRNGGCTDGTEILAILINRKKGFTVGQVVLFINIFIFAAYGLIFKDWHIALQSLMTYIVAVKMMDMVIAGLDEMKSVMILSSIPDKISKIIMHELGLGLTVIKGKGGFSGEDRDLLLVIVERLDLAELKEIVLREDPQAFMSVENLHEIAYGRKKGKIGSRKKTRKKMV
ncbi:MAG: YitT family protein [Chlamydiae bacterium CG10_big_fil_rev_8_21_14_0_10_35_9]|nr:MAG: YitT family protein [Chlamydiae bacterium CG10_big_fil_rev_8_21_14_0_10_35_9]